MLTAEGATSDPAAKMPALRVGLCQLTSSVDPETNLHLIAQHAAASARRGAQIVVFPEATMARVGAPVSSIAQPLDGPWATTVAHIANEHGVLIVAGMFTPATEEKVHNTLLITGRGEHRGYHKIHRYDAFGFRESDTIEAGDESVVISVNGVVLGFATCYDLRFPTLFRALAKAGAQTIIVPASWGAGPTKREQWELLVRARALDSGCWLVACDQADPEISAAQVPPHSPTGIGYSLIADGFGSVHVQLGPGPESIVMDIDVTVTGDAQRATGVLVNDRLG